MRRAGRLCGARSRAALEAESSCVLGHEHQVHQKQILKGWAAEQSRAEQSRAAAARSPKAATPGLAALWASGPHIHIRSARPKTCRAAPLSSRRQGSLQSPQNASETSETKTAIWADSHFRSRPGHTSSASLRKSSKAPSASAAAARHPSDPHRGGPRRNGGSGKGSTTAQRPRLAPPRKGGGTLLARGWYHQSVAFHHSLQKECEICSR